MQSGSGSLRAVVPVHETKRRLIADALAAVRKADGLDEQTSLTEAEALAWYGEVCPLTDDLATVVGALKVELALRRGALVARQGERRGGDRSKVDSGSTLRKADVDRRHRDRQLHEQKPAVRAYVRKQVKEGRVPTVKGALRAARAVAP